MGRFRWRLCRATFYSFNNICVLPLLFPIVYMMVSAWFPQLPRIYQYFNYLLRVNGQRVLRVPFSVYTTPVSSHQFRWNSFKLDQWGLLRFHPFGFPHAVAIHILIPFLLCRLSWQHSRKLSSLFIAMLKPQWFQWETIPYCNKKLCPFQVSLNIRPPF
jgi:hypothetical protein